MTWMVRIGAGMALAALCCHCGSESEGEGGTGGTATGGTGGTGGATGGSAGAPAGGRPCTLDCSSCGPLEECFEGRFCVARSVEVQTPSGAHYFIDATEVTRCQYAAWVATSPSTDGQDPWCVDETDFAADEDCMAEETACPANCAHHPQVCVTFCDAYAYCLAVGKRLCGAVGGGEAPFDSFDDAEVDQWYNACSSGGENRYPYGDDYEPATCNGYDHPESGCQTGSCQTRPGGDVATCTPAAPYAGVYDLSGNVFEWQDSCSSHVDGYDRCRFGGGSYISSYGDDGGNALRCSYDIAGVRNDRYSNLGFRCCSD